MNRQTNYIVAAFLLLLVLTVSGFLLQKIYKTSTNISESIVVDFIDDPAPIIMTIPENTAKGKVLFYNKCASCHNPMKDGTGPAFCGFEERGNWGNRNELYKWIRNPAKYVSQDPYTNQLLKTYGSMMPGFPDLSNQDIDDIVAYVNYICDIKTVLY